MYHSLQWSVKWMHALWTILHIYYRHNKSSAWISLSPSLAFCVWFNVFKQFLNNLTNICSMPNYTIPHIHGLESILMSYQFAGFTRSLIESEQERAVAFAIKSILNILIFRLISKSIGYAFSFQEFCCACVLMLLPHRFYCLHTQRESRASRQAGTTERYMI